jgi:uncharacterized membrane protein
VQWVIPPEQNGEFVARMEQVLEAYKRPYDPLRPLICMDESPRQLIRATRVPLAAEPGKPEREDYEYERCGVSNIFLAVEPLAGKRLVRVTEHRARTDWAKFLEEIAANYEHAEIITLVMDNLNTHGPGSLYEAFTPAKAKYLWERFEFIYTPKHGSWLNMAEIELNVLAKQCLSRRLESIEVMRSEVRSWQAQRNNLGAKINWQFTTDKARVKLKRLYPTFVE